MAEKRSTIDEARSATDEWQPTNPGGKHKNSRQIETDIDQTRYAMDRTMNEIGNRFNPRSFVDHMIDYFHKPEHQEQARHIARDAGNRLLDTVRYNPGAVLFLGGGVAWMLLGRHDGRRETREYYYAPEGSGVDARTGEAYPTEHETGQALYGREEKEGAGERAKKAAQGARQKAGGALESAREKGEGFVGSAREKGKGLLGSARGTAGESAGKARGSLQHQGERLQHASAQAGRQAQHRLSQGTKQAGKIARDNPVALGLGALALGILAGGLVPESRAEGKLMGRRSDQLKGRVAETAREGRERISEAAKQTAETAAGAAEKEGLAPGQQSEKAGKVAAETGEKAKQETAGKL
jgi:hypothetical protein